MTGELSLQKMLQGLNPLLATDIYVFATTDQPDQLLIENSFALIQETEGYTVIVKQTLADQLDLAYDYLAAKITIQVHSSLEAVGLTAALATQLAKYGISCNVVAGFYHDHLFVDYKHGPKAVKVLLGLRDQVPNSNT